MNTDWPNWFPYAFDPVIVDDWHQTRIDDILVSIKRHTNGGWIVRIPLLEDALDAKDMNLGFPSQLPEDSPLPTDIEISKGALWLWLLSPIWTAQTTVVWIQHCISYVKANNLQRQEKCNLCGAKEKCQCVMGASADCLLICPSCLTQTQVNQAERQQILDRKLFSPVKACLLVTLTSAVLWACLISLLDWKLDSGSIEMPQVIDRSTSVIFAIVAGVIFLILSGVPTLWFRRTKIKANDLHFFKLLTVCYAIGLLLGEHLRHEIFITRHYGFAHSPWAVFKGFFSLLNITNSFGQMIQLSVAISGVFIFYALAKYFYIEGSPRITLGQTLRLPPPSEKKTTANQFVITNIESIKI